MISVTKDVGLTSCWEETQPPKELTIKGPDGAVILVVTLIEPNWLDWQRTLAGGKVTEGIDYTIALMHLCIGGWSLNEPVTKESIGRLHPVIFAALAEATAEILTIKAEQLKNSVPLSQSNGSQPSSERAVSSTGIQPASGPTG